MLLLTSEALALWFGKICLKFFRRCVPTAALSPQPAIVARFLIDSPLPRAISLARASRLASMNAFALALPPSVSLQLLVPEVIPKVWLAEVPLVVAAKIWMIPVLLPKTMDPSPQPAVP